MKPDYFRRDYSNSGISLCLALPAYLDEIKAYPC